MRTLSLQTLFLLTLGFLFAMAAPHDASATTKAGKKLAAEIDGLVGVNKSGLKSLRKLAVAKLNEIAEELKKGELTPEQAGLEASTAVVQFIEFAHSTGKGSIAFASQLIEQASTEIDSDDLGTAVGATLNLSLQIEKATTKEAAKVEQALTKLQKKIGKAGGALISTGIRSEPIRAIAGTKEGDPAVTPFTQGSIQLAIGVKDGDQLTLTVAGTAETDLTTSVEVTFAGITVTGEPTPFDGTYSFQFGAIDLSELDAPFAELRLKQTKTGAEPWTADVSSIQF